jgi:Mg2+ and Co2+ transporter CorA
VYPLTTVEYNNDFNEETDDETVIFDDFDIDEKEKTNKTQLLSVDIVYFKALVIKKI